VTRGEIESLRRLAANPLPIAEVIGWRTFQRRQLIEINLVEDKLVCSLTERGLAVLAVLAEGEGR
jgi:hypothetical protein